MHQAYSPDGERTSLRSTDPASATPHSLTAAHSLSAPASVAGLAQGAPFFVYGVLAVLLAASLTLVRNYAHNVPYGECWYFMPVLCEAKPLTTGWLWDHMYEHRFPLTRLVIAGLFHLGGGDLRVAMYFNVLVMAASALALIRLTQRLRGWQSYADAFFPLVLLQLALAQSALWHGNLTFTVPAALTFGVLTLVLRADVRLSRGRACLLGAALLALSLCGGWGFLVVPPLLLWVAYQSWTVWYRTSPRSTLVLVGFAAAAVVALGLYFLDYAHPAYVQTSNLTLTADVALQFLSNGLGPGLQKLWPFPAFCVAVLLLATLTLLALSWRHGSNQGRARALGLFFVIAAVVLLAGVTGYRRAHSIEFAGFQWRYVWTSVPWVCCTYFVWELFAPPVLRHGVQMGLCLTASLLFGTVAQEAVQEAHRFHDEPARLELLLQTSAAQGGLPISAVMKYFADGYYRFFNPEPMIQALRALHKARIGQFRHLRDDTPYQDRALDPARAAASQLTRKNGKWHGTGPDSFLAFPLDGPTYVVAVRLTFATTNPAGTESTLRVSWKGEASETSEREVQECKVDASGSVTVVIWVCDTIEEFQIHPDQQPFTFQLLQVSAQLAAP